MTETNKLSPLEEWAYELDPDYPQDGTIDAIKIQTHRDLMRKRSVQGALWLLEQLEEWYDKTDFIDPEGATGALEVIREAQQLCGKEAKS